MQMFFRTNLINTNCVRLDFFIPQTKFCDRGLKKPTTFATIRLSCTEKKFLMSFTWFAKNSKCTFSNLQLTAKQNIPSLVSHVFVCCPIFYIRFSFDPKSKLPNEMEMSTNSIRILFSFHSSPVLHSSGFLSSFSYPVRYIYIYSFRKKSRANFLPGDPANGFLAFCIFIRFSNVYLF